LRPGIPSADAAAEGEKAVIFIFVTNLFTDLPPFLH
jgi:hypothetical protein